MILYFFLLLTIAVTGLALGWVVRKPDCRVKIPDEIFGMHPDMIIVCDQVAGIKTRQSQGAPDNKSSCQGRLELDCRDLATENRREIVTKCRTRRERGFLTVAVLSVPFFTWAIYLLTGFPDIPSAPFSLLMLRDPATLDHDQRLVRAEVLASRNPEDGNLVDKLAKLYLFSGRFQDAVNTYSRAIAINGESVARLSGYAVALTGFEGGVVGQDAENVFHQVVRLDPENPDAHIFLARGLIQSGKTEEAVRLLEDFLRAVPERVSWHADLADVVADLKKSRSPEVDRRYSGSGPEQYRLIAAGIDRLAKRLEARPDDLRGWMMLIRSHLVLGQYDEARTSLQQGLRALPPDMIGQLVDFWQEKKGGGTGGILKKWRVEKTVE